MTDADAEPADAAVALTDEQTWCQEQAQRHREALAAQADSFPRDPAEDCRDGYAYRADALLPPKAAETWLRGRYEVVIVHRERDGSTRIVHTFRLASAETWGSEVLSQFVTGDIDGDGLAEVYWTVVVHEEGVQPFKGYLMRLDKATGRLKPVALPGGVQPMGLEDVDHDGRFDVPTAGPYATMTHPTAIGGDSPWFHDGMFLLHSLGGFRFDARDGVAQGWTRKFCSRPMEAGLPGPEPAAGRPDYRVPERIVCDRIEGRTAHQVANAIRAQCPKLQGDPIAQDACMRSLLDLAAPEPLTRYTP